MNRDLAEHAILNLAKPPAEGGFERASSSMEDIAAL